MTDPEARLGGRLPLLDPDTLTPTQKALWDHMDVTLGRWAEGIGFRCKTFEGRYIGPFNPVLRSPKVGRSFLQL